MKARSGLVVCLVFVGTAGCGGGKSESEAFADSYCAEVVKCCAQAGLSTDGKSCHARLALAAGAGSYDAAAGEACLAEVKAQAGAGTLCRNLSRSSVSACDGVFGSGSHSKQPGEGCDSDGDCATSSDGEVVCVHEYVGSAFVGKCQVRVSGKAGDTPCVGTRDGNDFEPYSDSNATEIPSQGYVCNIADGIRCRLGICKALFAMGESCDLPSDCVRGAFCDLDAHVCATRVAAGGACAGGNSLECVDGNYCSSSSKQCTAKVTNGSDCDTGSMCQSGYCINNSCLEDLSGLSTVCES
ncbi:MAG: hypothetical protein JXP73_22330 [Deltaproteobacteria bacterium]|nr:hypothetical protein [Deltaproteobacteria bacterium]